MENNGNIFENGLILVHTDYDVQRYIPDIADLKKLPEEPLTEEERKRIFELDFPMLSQIYARVYSRARLLSAGETSDDLIQEAYERLPVFFARYDRSRKLTPAQAKNFKSIRRDFKRFYHITVRDYRDKTLDNIKSYRQTKYAHGKNQTLIMPETFFESLHCTDFDKLTHQRFLNIRRELWAKLPPEPANMSEDYKLGLKDERNPLQRIVDMKDDGVTIGSIRFEFGRYGWNKEQRLEALETIEKYLDTLWEKTHHMTGQVHENWASDWLEAIAESNETSFIKANNKSQQKAA